MIINNDFNELINAPVRSFRGRVEFYEGSTLNLVCGCHDRLKSFTVERVGEDSKFFGFGICQKINAHILDKDRELNITTANSIEVEFGKDEKYIYPYPRFYVSEVNRDEETNELSITAYDALYKAAEHTIDELALPAPPSAFTVADFAKACGALLGLPTTIPEESVFDNVYADELNFEGTETIREALDALAEATQTIYFIDWDWRLTFKRLDKDGEAALIIDKEKYIDLDSKSNRRLASICHVTELSDNVSASLEVAGTTQYVRNNPFWDMRGDIGELVEDALAAVGGLTINQFECFWRGNFLLEIGDKIAMVTKDDETVYSYVLDDVITFDGALSEQTRWEYGDSEGETESNPASLGDALKQTYARVDKANKEIELVTQRAEANSEEISELRVKTDEILLSVESIDTRVSDSLVEIGDELTRVSNKVDVAVTSEQVEFLVQEKFSQGVTSVETTTGFTFDENGLTVSKNNSDITTTVTEIGMSVRKDDVEVLFAGTKTEENGITKSGVYAEDLHATTYLVIGNNSRFEDWSNQDGESRTGCFWIGG